jgi:hypothetical protein
MGRITSWSRDSWSKLLLVGSIALVGCGDDGSPPFSLENTVSACSDGLDNDSDGLVDCADTECVGYAICGATDGGPPRLDGGPPVADLGASGCSVLIDSSGFGVTDSCTGGNICICTPDATCEAGCNSCLSPGTCEPALPRRYRLSPVYAYVPVTKPSGEGWDGDGSGPDLFAAMAVDGTGRFQTATANDLTLDADGDFTAIYSGTFADFNLIAGSSITAEVSDEDALADDAAFMCEWSANPMLARARFIECAGDELGGFGAFIVPL